MRLLKSLTERTGGLHTPCAIAEKEMNKSSYSSNDRAVPSFELRTRRLGDI